VNTQATQWLTVALAVALMLFFAAVLPKANGLQVSGIRDPISCGGCWRWSCLPGCVATDVKTDDETLAQARWRREYDIEQETVLKVAGFRWGERGCRSKYPAGCYRDERQLA
jgi:hypothetical protein